MKNDILLSILIPVYNGEEYIENCLNSVLDQDLKKCEIIIVDDGSTDKTIEIIERIKSSCKYKVNVISSEHFGLSETRNILIENANGKYIIFIDSDDYIEDGLIKKLKETIKEDDYDLIRYKAMVHNDKSYKPKDRFNTTKFGKISRNEAIKSWSNKNEEWAVTWVYCYKRSIFVDNNISFEKNKLHEDFGTIPKVIMKCNNIICIDFLGYHYIKRYNSIIENHEEEYEWKKAEDYLYQFDSLIKYLDSIKLKEVDEDLYKFFVNDLKKRMPEKLRFLQTDYYKMRYKEELAKRDISVEGSYSFD